VHDDHRSSRGLTPARARAQHSHNCTVLRILMLPARADHDDDESRAGGGVSGKARSRQFRGEPARLFV
jgi:hypothetical protein